MLHKDWQETNVEATAKNASYHSGKPYFKRMPVNHKGEQGFRWVKKHIPTMLDLSNTDTFHTYGRKGANAIKLAKA